MSNDACKVLAKQIEVEKRYMTGLRQLISVLADLADKRTSILIAAGYIKTLGYDILAVAGIIGAATKKKLIGRIMGVIAALAGGSSRFTGRLSERTLLEDKDYRTVQGMIDEAMREFMAADRRMRQLRREYKELGCEVKYGSAP